jgi:hypothetical protein
VNTETKEQSKQWIHTHTPKKPKNFNERLPAKKLTATAFWDRKGVLMLEFMLHEVAITSEVYCETLKHTGSFRKKALNADIRYSDPS